MFAFWQPGVMAQLRDYDEWHREYDDPGSDLSWRLRRVQAHLGDALERHPGACRIVSACSGDGRDLIGVLSTPLALMARSGDPIGVRLVKR